MENIKQRRTFISYSRTNKDFALRLAKELRSSGFNIWLDQLDIPTGARWDDEVEKALASCEIFMVILTPASSASDNVRDEIGYAIDTHKRILPVLLEFASIPLRLRRFQYVDFTTKSFEEGVASAKQLLTPLVQEPIVPKMDVPPSVRAQKAGEDQKAAVQPGDLATQKAKEDRLVEMRDDAERKARRSEEPSTLAVERENVEKASALLRQAKQLLANGASSEAIQVFQKILTLMPNHEETLGLLAKAEEERLARAKAEADRKAKEEASRLAAQKKEAERSARQKAEEERLARPKADPAFFSKIKALIAPAATAHKKPISRRLVLGIVSLLVFAIAGIALSAVSKNRTSGLIPVAGGDMPILAHSAEPTVASTPTKNDEGSPEVIESLLPTAIPETLSCQTPTASIRIDSAYLREGPDVRFIARAQYDKGDPITVLGRYQDWFQVEAPDEEKGWLYKDWISLPSNIDATTICSISAEELPSTPQTSQQPKKTPQSGDECIPSYYISCP